MTDRPNHRAAARRYIAFPARNPKPGDEVDIYELGEPEPRRVPGWVAKRNEHSGRIAADVRIEG